MLNKYKEGNGLQYRAVYGENFGVVLSRLQGTTVSRGTGLQRALIELSPKLSKGKPDIHGLGLSIELKTGIAFDTKKASKEVEEMFRYAEEAGLRPTLCCFLAENRESIYAEFKADLTGIEVLTGRELCVLAEIDYDIVLNAAGFTESRAAREELLDLLCRADELDNN